MWVSMQQDGTACTCSRQASSNKRRDQVVCMNWYSSISGLQVSKTGTQGKCPDSCCEQRPGEQCAAPLRCNSDPVVLCEFCNMQLWQHPMRLTLLNYARTGLAFADSADCGTAGDWPHCAVSFGGCLAVPSPQQQLAWQPLQLQQPALNPAPCEAPTSQPAIEVPGSAAELEPLLCIKRTYQPHPKRWKRKHGFLKR